MTCSYMEGNVPKFIFLRNIQVIMNIPNIPDIIISKVVVLKGPSNDNFYIRIFSRRTKVSKKRLGIWPFSKPFSNSWIQYIRHFGQTLCIIQHTDLKLLVCIIYKGQSRFHSVTIQYSAESKLYPLFLEQVQYSGADDGKSPIMFIAQGHYFLFNL